MKLFRLTHTRFGPDLTGTGNAYVGSRWISKGHRAFYCASTPSAACWNFFVHLDRDFRSHYLSNLALVVIDVPDHVSRKTIRRSDALDAALRGFDFAVTQEIGDRWIVESSTCLLAVPLPAPPGDLFYIVNPGHDDFEQLAPNWLRLHVSNPKEIDVEQLATLVSRVSFDSLPDNKPDPKRRVFLCHASEDKNAIVRPVREALFERGVSSWFDDAELTLGDSITSKINQGLRDADYVVVFISPSFVRKPYPKKELDAALNREARTGRKVVLPIVIHYEAEKVDYESFLPLAEDKLYCEWQGDAGRVAQMIENAIRRDAP